jgi:copper chaperone
MIRFRIQDMACGHCVAHVTDAVRTVLPAARVEIDLATKLATVDGFDAGKDAGNGAGNRSGSGEAGKAGDLRKRLADAIVEAGYTPEPA